MQNLDTDLLRTFLAVARSGSVTDGAALIHRSQSATSIQIKRLEEVLGRPVFERHGRGVVLNETGRKLLSVAQEVTSRLDSIQRELADDALEGKVRLAIPDDRGRDRLARIIADFARRQPLIELEVTCSDSTRFAEALKKDEFDLAIYEVASPAPGEELLSEELTCWVSSARHDFTGQDILPVALFDRRCWWRDAALDALEARGKPYRIVYSSQSVAGIVAAVEAGIAVGLVGRSSVHSGLVIAGRDHGFEPSPASRLVMAAAPGRGAAPVEAMRASVRAAFQAGSVG